MQVAHTARLEKTDIYAGTIRYMAPELYDDNPECTRATDVWAFGCLMLHLFSLQEPWQGLELTGVQRRLIMKTPLPIYDNVPEPISEIIQKCCQIDPRQRPKFGDIRVELLNILNKASYNS